MHLLVACPKCKRQYDASALPIGKRFRCHCGTVLTVHEPRAHDAAVVCCAHCGAPRSDGALKCAFCGADFTLHERDLDTVCPHCFSRISNKAKFCSSCGAAIHPQTIAGEKSKYLCPVCREDHFLTSRAWGDVSALECNRCAGLWMEGGSFGQLVQGASAERTGGDGTGYQPQVRPPQVEGPPPDGGRRYRPCPLCGQLMVKQNYARASGVVIDICRNHGMWFDADELPRILDWIRAGGLVAAGNGWQTHEETVIVNLDGQQFELDPTSLQQVTRQFSHDSSMAAALGGLARWLSRQ